MKDVFIETSRVAEFRHAISIVEDTIKGHPGIMTVVGKTGRGKTSCVDKYATDTPAVHMKIWNELTPLALLKEICLELNGMDATNKVKAKKIIIEELDNRPRTIMIDEADKLCVNCIEHLRDIHDMTGIPLILIGEPKLYATLHARKRIWSRVTKTVEFGPVEIEDILVLGQKACDLKILPEGAHALLKRCKGDFRPLYHDLRDLEGIARTNNLTKIDFEIIKSLPNRNKPPKSYKEL